MCILYVNNNNLIKRNGKFERGQGRVHGRVGECRQKFLTRQSNEVSLQRQTKEKGEIIYL